MLAGVCNPEHLRGCLDPRCEEGNAAVNIIIRCVDGIPSVLMIRRVVKEGDPWSGDTAFPGGRAERLGEGAVGVALRETLEEVGIAPGNLEVLGCLPPAQTYVIPGFKVVPVVTYLREEAAVRVHKDEVSEYFWIPLEVFLGREVSVLHPLRGWRVKGYVYGNALVWGLSRRIIKDFIQRLRECGLLK